MPAPSPRRRLRPVASARQPHTWPLVAAVCSFSWHDNHGWHPPKLTWFSSGLCGWFPVLVALEGSLAGDAEVTTDEGPVGSVAAESEYVFLLALGKEFA